MPYFNKVGRPLARIKGGKYNGTIVSVPDHFASNADADDEDQNGLIKEFRQLSMANDTKFPAHTRYDQGERDSLHHRSIGLGKEHTHP